MDWHSVVGETKREGVAEGLRNIEPHRIRMRCSPTVSSLDDVAPDGDQTGHPEDRASTGPTLDEIRQDEVEVTGRMDAARTARVGCCVLVWYHPGRRRKRLAKPAQRDDLSTNRPQFVVDKRAQSRPGIGLDDIPDPPPDLWLDVIRCAHGLRE